MKMKKRSRLGNFKGKRKQRYRDTWEDDEGCRKKEKGIYRPNTVFSQRRVKPSWELKP